MPQPKDYDPHSTDPNFRQQYFGGYARAHAGGGGGDSHTTMKWVFGIMATVIGGIIILQLQFFGSAVIEQGKVMARLDERVAYMQESVRKQGEENARERTATAERLNRLEQWRERRGGER